MVRYRLFEETRSLEGTEHKVYGIMAIDERGDSICTVPNITSNMKKALAFAELCERWRLSPLHLSDAVEDFIISNYY